MRESIILRSTTRLIEPLLLLFAIFLLLVGHNEPGGGFAGGLVASGAFALHTLVFGVESARRSLWVSPPGLLAAGLLVAIVSGLPGLLAGKPFLSGVWAQAGDLYLGTPLLFDAGVFLVVTGVVTQILFVLAED
jgi:multicomponent Na+:H+ antiporter subunit B